MDGLAAPKMPPLMIMSWSCTLWLCVIGGETCEVGISFGAIQSIFTDILGMSKVSARWLPQMLTDDQKRTRLNISRYLLSRYEDDFIERVVTQDDTWVNHFYRESKMQSKQWKHPGSPTRWFIQQKRWWPQSLGKVKRWSWLMLIFWARMHIMQTNWGGYARKSQERCEENWLAVFCSFRTTSLSTHHKLPWMLRQNVDLKSFLIPHILLVWLLISICAQKWNPICVVLSMEAMKAS